MFRTRAEIAGLVLVAFTTACGARPPRFVDAPPAQVVADDKPIQLPRQPPFVEPVYLSEVYLRRPLLNVLEPRRAPRAQDVNAWDEVPRSSWFAGAPATTLPFAGGDGPPQPPWTMKTDGGAPTSLTDARHLSYRLVFDAHDKPKTRTAAGLIASRIARAIGYHTPATWLVNLRSGGESRPATALRWPIGVEIGPTAPSGTRGDDANDRIAHEDRRTLRALPLMMAWLDASLGAKDLRDVYVGMAGHGHVHHILLGLFGALGAGRVEQAVPEQSAVGTVQGNALVNLVTLGLARPDPSEPEGDDLRVLSRELDPAGRLTPPFAPSDRLRADDGYWMIKRMLSVEEDVLTSAVASAELERVVADHVLDALLSRRALLARHWLGRVSPLELVRITRSHLVLEDLAVKYGFRPRGSYVVGYFDDDGDPVTQPLRTAAKGQELALLLPREPRYLIVRVRSVRGSEPASRPFEAHVIRDAAGARVIGMTH